MTTVVSFYTADWDYPKYAMQLQDDCERLGLAHYIVKRESTDDYVKNCNIKPFFIRDMLLRFKSPVFWIDVDGSIISSPKLLLTLDINNFDMAANRSVKDPSRIHVGSIWFNYTQATLEFVDAWCANVIKRGIDDAVFNGIWGQFVDKIKFYELPSEYFFILPTPTSTAPENVCVVHRLSASPLKQSYKNNCKKTQ
jgi:hypothetical protein